MTIVEARDFPVTPCRRPSSTHASHLFSDCTPTTANHILCKCFIYMKRKLCLAGLNPELKIRAEKVKLKYGKFITDNT